MVAPLLIAGGLTAGAGLAGSIFGRKKAKSFDPTRTNQLAGEQYDAEATQAGRIRPETDKILGTYNAGTDAAQAQAQEARRANASGFLQNFDKDNSALVKSQSDMLKQSLFSQLPELQQAQREAAAAGGGLNRGYASAQAAGLPTQLASQYATGATELGNTALSKGLDARSNVYSGEHNAILNDLGVDTNQLGTSLNTKNQALLNEINSLLSATNSKFGTLKSSEAARQNSKIAASAGDAAAHNGIFSSLTNLGGTMMGAGLSPAGSNATGSPSINFDDSQSQYLRKLLAGQTGANSNLSLYR